ncbi:hypothetical protein DYB30_014270, partial [Aphanomyces astaci]
RVQKLQEKNLVREEAAKKARAAEDAKAKAKRAKEAKAIAAVAAKAADEAAKEAAESATFASCSTWAREDAQVEARLSTARPVNPFARYNPPSGPQRDGQLTAAERQAVANYKAGARPVAAPQHVVGPMSWAATPGTAGEEEEKSTVAEEEEESPREPEDRLPSLHRA